MRQQLVTLKRIDVDCVPAALAATADLVYDTDGKPGFRRRRIEHGFTYIDANGKTVT